MKKLLTFAALLCCAAYGANALNITDPLYMPRQGDVVSQTDYNITGHAFKQGDSLGLVQSIQIGVNDKLALGVSLGWAKIKHEHSGFQDPVLSARYRFLDGNEQNLFLDLQGYISPEVFDSPYNNEDGSAKGSTDFGLHSIVGSTDIMPNFTLTANTGFDYVGGSDNLDSGSVWSLGGSAKYYINDIHSVQADVVAKAYLGFDEDFGGYGLGVNYAWQAIPETLAVVPFVYIEARDSGFKTEKDWGFSIKYLF